MTTVDPLRTLHSTDAARVDSGPPGSDPGVAGHQGSDAGSNPAAFATAATDTFDRTLLWRFRAQLLRVLDGDSCRLLCDTGFGGRHEVAIRLLGFSAPERYQAGGPEATQRLHDALARGVGEWPLRVATLQRETVVSEVRSFERYVAQVWVAAPEGLLPVGTWL